MSITVLLIFAATISEPDFPDARTNDVTGFAIASFIFAMCQRGRRLQEFRRGIPNHSYYIGTSRLAFGWLPEFFKRQRRMERLADPIFCMVFGAALIPISPALGCWIIFAGISINCTEKTVRLNEFNTELDMLDSYIASQVHSQTVERYTQSSNAPQQRPSAGISTGLGPDIKKNIKKRKQ
jgi:hypothetical protein